MKHPKDRAKEIVDLFHTQLGLNEYECVICALLCVSEIQEGLAHPPLINSPYTTLEARQYYLSVKFELEKLNING